MKRYERQIMLPEIGISGQQKLAEARVLIIGLGGLGCPVLQNLAGAGVGTIGIVDGDLIDETNLHRQFLYNADDFGKSKVAMAQKAISKQNPDVNIISYPVQFADRNCFLIASDYQVVVDCTDTIATRYLINDVAVAKGIPMVYASIHKFEGQLSVFNYQKGPTFRCLFPGDERLETIPNCNDSGVLGVLPNVLGALQANEVLKIILGIGEVLSGKLMLFDSLGSNFEIIEFQKVKNNFDKIKFNNNNVSAADFFADSHSLIIDIREEYEEPKLNLQNIKNVPLQQLDGFLKGVDANQKITLVCQHGNRSQLAADYLIKKGFTNVFHLQGGIASLEQANSDDNR